MLFRKKLKVEVVADNVQEDAPASPNNLPSKKAKEKHSLLVKFSSKPTTAYQEMKIKDDGNKQLKQTSSYTPIK